jgi:hypothetical protein
MRFDPSDYDPNRPTPRWATVSYVVLIALMLYLAIEMIIAMS